MRILAVNAGSSSLKLSVIVDATRTEAQVSLGSPGAPETTRELNDFLAGVRSVEAVVHRLVHGGPHLRAPHVIDDGVRAQLADAVELAPLHLPPALALVDRLRGELMVPHVACFDTGFHADMPEAATTYALPQEWRDQGVRRYGFHGLSYAWSSLRAAEILERDRGDLCLVIAHLGSGSSVCAVQTGRSVDTTMGFTPTEGVVMATRSGSVDPGALLWLQTARGVDAGAMSAALEHGSGWKALSGSVDMRDLIESCEEPARLAVDIVLRSFRSGIAAMASALPRLDALVFTGGIGAHAQAVQARLCAGLGVLGVCPLVAGAARVHSTADGDSDAVLSGAADPVAVLSIEAREDLQMAHEAEALLG